VLKLITLPTAIFASVLILVLLDACAGDQGAAGHDAVDEESQFMTSILEVGAMAILEQWKWPTSHYVRGLLVSVPDVPKM
jgi:hypothetical protein